MQEDRGGVCSRCSQVMVLSSSLGGGERDIVVDGWGVDLTEVVFVVVVWWGCHY